jgi:hypothetical protein
MSASLRCGCRLVRAGTRVSIRFDCIDRYGCASFDLQTQESHRSHVPTTDVCLAHVLSNTYEQFQSPEEWQYVLHSQVCFARAVTSMACAVMKWAVV